MFKLIIIVAFFILFLNACNFSDGDNSPYTDFVYGECIRGGTGFMLKEGGTVSDYFIGESPIDNVEKMAILTNSESKTHVHLTSVDRYCDSNVKIKTNKITDTLMLEEYFPKDYNISSCICSSTMNLTLESIEDSIKYVIYGKGQVFPARYE